MLWRRSQRRIGVHQILHSARYHICSYYKHKTGVRLKQGGSCSKCIQCFKASYCISVYVCVKESHLVQASECSAVLVVAVVDGPISSSDQNKRAANMYQN